VTDLVDALRGVVGPAGLLDLADGAHLLTDERGAYTGSAVAIVRPASTAEVAEVIRGCVAAGAAVVTQGGNTGMAGGATPTVDRPSVLMTLTRMDGIESVDADRWSMTVQAGATIQAVQDAAAAVDRQFAPDWGARGSATVGGAIATDAGGNNVLRYGNMRDNVMGVEVVLADGRVWNGLRALRKDSSGYDLKQLFVGSEGTLGVVTRAVLKLHPATTDEQSALAALADMDRLMALYALAQEAAPDMVTAFELVPDVGIDRVCEVHGIGRPLDTRADFYVLVRLASNRPVTEPLTEYLARAEDLGLITDAVVAATPEQEERLWMIRDEQSPSRIFRDHLAPGLKLDVAVPLDRMGELHARVHAIAAEVVPDALAYGFGHVGDGNLHMMVLPVGDDHVEAFLDRKPELEARVDAAVFELGGTLSAEHGIGQVLRGRIAGQKPAIEWEMMRAIKAAFDPDDVLNPGKVLPD